MCKNVMRAQLSISVYINNEYILNVLRTFFQKYTMGYHRRWDKDLYIHIKPYICLCFFFCCVNKRPVFFNRHNALLLCRNSTRFRKTSSLSRTVWGFITWQTFPVFVLLCPFFVVLFRVVFADAFVCVVRIWLFLLATSSSLK